MDSGEYEEVDQWHLGDEPTEFMRRVMPAEEWATMDEDDIVKRIDGPALLATRDDDQKQLSEWRPYKGPQGGEGWENAVTGEVRFQEKKPEDIAPLPEEEPGESIGEVTVPGDGGAGDGEIDYTDPEQVKDKVAEWFEENDDDFRGGRVTQTSEGGYIDQLMNMLDADADPADIVDVVETFASIDELGPHTEPSNTYSNLETAVFEAAEAEVKLPDGETISVSGEHDQDEVTTAIYDALNLPDDEAQLVDEARHLASLSPQKGSGAAAPLHLASAAMTGREYLGEHHSAVLEIASNIRDVAEVEQRILAALFGPSPKLYRGQMMSGDGEEVSVLDKDGDTIIKRETDDTKTFSSWSLGPHTAMYFGKNGADYVSTVLLVDGDDTLDNAVMSTVTGQGFDEEHEVLRAEPQTSVYDAGEALMMEARTDALDTNEDIRERGGDLLTQSDDFIRDASTRSDIYIGWLESVKQWPSMQRRREEQGKALARALDGGDKWRKYRGPRGGEGWQHVETGNVVYGPEKPGPGDSRPEEVAPDAKQTPEQEYAQRYAPNPTADIERFREDETMSELLNGEVGVNTEKGVGGFTIQRNLQAEGYDVFEEDTWSVAIASTNIPEEQEMTKDDIIDFYETWMPVLEDFPSLRIGGFWMEDEPYKSIDLVVQVDDKDEAEEVGEFANQESIFNPFFADQTGFDMSEGELEKWSVPTGGDGDSPIETPEEARKLLDTIESKRQLHTMSRRMEKGSGGADMVWERDDGLRVSGTTFVQQFIHASPVLEPSEDGLIVGGRLWRRIR